MEKSAIPVDHGFANPFLGQAAHLIANAAQFREIAVKIQQLGKGSGKRHDIKAMLTLCGDAGIKEMLRKQFEAYQRVEPSPPVLGMPPSPVEVYGRFGKGVSITDIGSGNCMKLRKFTGSVRITSVDPDLRVPKSLVLKAKFCVPFSDYIPRLLPDEILTSHMALCQLPMEEQTIVHQHDGLHLQPDHALLISSSVATLHGQDVKVNTIRGVYIDKPVHAGGYAVESGYRLLASFRERAIDVQLSDSENKVSYMPVIDATPASFTEFDLSDVGWKWDGTPWELELSGGAAYYVNRAGTERVGTSNFPYHLCVHVEALPDCFVLLRVVAYRGMIPPHCGETLRKFASKVKMKINGKPVCGPPIYQPGAIPILAFTSAGGEHSTFTAPTDGLISRVKEKDLYCKHQWTLDLRDDKAPRLEKLLTGLGMDLEAEWKPGLWEYGVDRHEALVKLTPLRLRTDKKKETTMDTVKYLLQRTTLQEQQALY